MTDSASADLLDAFRAAIVDAAPDRLRQLLASSAELRGRINAPIGPFGSRAVQMAARDPGVMDVLLDFGADINLRSDWENGPFSVRRCRTASETVAMASANSSVSTG